MLKISSKTYNVYGITAIVAISGILLGLESSSLTAFLTSPQFKEYFGEFNKWDLGIITSSNSIGAATGCIFCGALCDMFGCTRAFQVSGIIWIIGTIIVYLSPYIHLVVVGRMVKGFSMGIISAVIPVYISETIPCFKKGTSISIVHLSSTIGTLSIYFIGYFLQRFVRNEYCFKYTWALQAIPALMLLILSFFLPESPKWLAFHSKWNEAASSLARIEKHQYCKLGLKKDSDTERKRIGDKSYVIHAYTAGTEIKHCSFAELFGKRFYKHTMVGIAIQSLVQLTCINTLMYFFVYICGMCGLKGDHKILAVSFQYIVSALFTIFPIFLLDNCRRKDSLIFGLFVLGLSFSTIYFLNFFYGKPILTQEYFQNNPFDWKLQGIPASAMFALFLLIVSIYASAIVSVSWLYTGEIFPSPARSKGTSICMCASWMLNAGLTLVVPFAIKALGPWLFAVLAVFCFFGSTLLLTFPETRDLTELQLESLYSTKKRKSNNITNMNLLYSGDIPHQAIKDIDNEVQDSNKVSLLVPTEISSIDRDKKIYEEIKIATNDNNRSPAPKGVYSSTGSDHSAERASSNSNLLFIRKADMLENDNGSSSHRKRQTVKLELRSDDEFSKTFSGSKQSNNLIDKKDLKRTNDSNKRTNSVDTLSTVKETSELYTARENLESQHMLSSPEESYYSNDWFDNALSKSINNSPVSGKNSSAPPSGESYIQGFSFSAQTIEDNDNFYHFHREGSPKRN